MVRLKLWQWGVLILPIALVVAFILIAAGSQIHTWGINWIWAVFTVVLVGWRWLLVRWTSPAIKQLEAAVEQVSKELESSLEGDVTVSAEGSPFSRAEGALQDVLTLSANDRPLWEDWTTFWQRCRELVGAIAHIYHPEIKYPLLNIYVPDAYQLIRGTVNDLDLWMEKLSPVLKQVTVGQTVEAYEVYQKLEPSARKLWQAWNWAQWLLNPAAAVARRATMKSSDRATQQLLGNLNQLLREALLRNLAQQAIALYSGMAPAAIATPIATPSAPPKRLEAKTQTLRDILAQAEPVEAVEQKPVNLLLVGRTGAGKSSLINTLFQSDQAEVDVLPSTDRIQQYHWQLPGGESLTLWDSPGYEQVNREDFRDQVLDQARDADLLLLVTPALDPALQMDVDFLKDVQAEIPDLPAISIVTQVDKLRPIREWEPPYDWQWGNRPKEISIREATQYRIEQLGEYCDRVFPIVTADQATGRKDWNGDALSIGLVEAIAPTKQLRLARFLKNQDARILGAAKIIDHYTFQMTTQQGLAALLKSPVLQFITTLTTGSPTLAYLLAEQIPVEQLPIVIGKLQMAYDLFNLLNPSLGGSATFELLALWPLMLDNSAPPDRTAWATGHALVEYWTRSLTIEQLQERYRSYL